MIKFIKNFIAENTGVIIRLDDITENMNWHFMDKCELLFDKYNIKPLLGVIPNNKDSDLLLYPKKENFWEHVRKWSDKGWEISMHGNTHVYETNTNKKDFFGYGGRSEFFGQDYNIQKSKIEIGLKKFKDEKINIRSFFAPNHTYDLNTLRALKDCKLAYVIDGYGLMPYGNDGLTFIPQLFYKEILLPFGIQSTQVHLNYWKDKDFDKFEKFISDNYKKIVPFDYALTKINNNLVYKSINFFTKITLKILRLIRK